MLRASSLVNPCVIRYTRGDCFPRCRTSLAMFILSILHRFGCHENGISTRLISILSLFKGRDPRLQGRHPRYMGRYPRLYRVRAVLHRLH